METVIIRNSLASVGRFTLTALINLALLPFMLRHLGASKFGVWVLVSLVITLVRTNDLGVTTTTTKTVANEWLANPSKVGQTVVNVLFLQLCYGSLLALVLISFRSWVLTSLLKISLPYLQEASSTFAIACLTLPVILLFAALCGVLDGAQQMHLSGALIVFTTLLNAIATWWLLRSSHGLQGLMLSQLLTSLVGLALAGISVLHVCPDIIRNQGRVRLGKLWQILSYGIKIQSSQFLGFVGDAFVKILFSHSFSLAYVGYYEAAFKAASTLRVLLSAALHAVLPAFASISGLGRWHLAREIYRNSIRYIGVVIVPAVIFFMLFAASVMRVWLHADFPVLVFLFQGLMLAYFVNLLAVPASLALQGVGLGGRTAIAALTNLVLLVALAPSLIPPLGFAGVVYGIFAGQFAATLFLLHCLHQKIRFGIADFLRILAGLPAWCSLVVAILLHQYFPGMSGLSLVIVMTIFFTLVLVFNVVFGGVGRAEWTLIVGALTSFRHLRQEAVGTAPVAAGVGAGLQKQ